MRLKTSILSASVVGGLLAAGGMTLSSPSFAQDNTGAEVKPVFAAKLPNVPGKSLTGAIVTYAPSVSSRKHRHAGSVLAYVLSGEIRSENSATGPVKIYKAGEWFFEPPGSEHTISGNASKTEPASLLAISVADDGAKLTTIVK